MANLLLNSSAILLASASVIADDRPNILYIMSDDHSTAAISAYSDKLIQTPNIDRLAKEGMRFNHVYATNSICTPSRACILTGKYSHKNGVIAFNSFDGSQPHLGKYLQHAGYYTAVVGKWHLHSDPTGFTTWEIFPGQGSYENPHFYGVNNLEKDAKRFKVTYQGTHSSDKVADRTIHYLENRPKDKPFFMKMHFKAPHRNWVPAKRYSDIWRKKVIPEPPTLFDNWEGRSGALKWSEMSILKHMTQNDVKNEFPIPKDLSPKELLRWKYQRYMQDYLACVNGVDDNVGRVLKWLDDNGLAENTIVVYTADQGFFVGEHGLYDKRFAYEEAIKMPFIVRWPKKIDKGTISDAIGINCDFAPTFMEAAGLSVPKDMQGESMIPILTNKGVAPKNWRQSFYYRYYDGPNTEHRVHPHYAVSNKQYKLIYFDVLKEWELYDLVNDPDELTNIYNDKTKSEIIKTMKKELEALRKKYEDVDFYSYENVEKRKKQFEK